MLCIKKIIANRKLLFISLLIINGCSHISELQNKIWSNPKIKLSSMKFGEPSKTEITFIPSVDISNQNAFTIIMGSVNYTMEFDDSNIVVNFDTTGDSNGIAARSSMTIDMPVVLTNETKNLFSQTLIKKTQIDYKVSGDVRFLGFPLPFQDEGKIHIPKINTGSFTTYEVNRTSLDMSLELIITNDNVFATTPYTISYYVFAHGQRLFKNSILQQKVASNSEAKVKIPLLINPTNIYTSILQVLEIPLFVIEVYAVVDFGFVSIPTIATTSLRMDKLL